TDRPDGAVRARRRRRRRSRQRDRHRHPARPARRHSRATAHRRRGGLSRFVMSTPEYIQAIDAWVDNALLDFSDHAGIIFDVIERILNGFNDSILWVLNLLPFYAVALIIGALGWRLVGLRFGLMAALGLILCALMDLWPDTMSTLSLVIAATLMALAVAIPAGILTGYVHWLYRIAEPVLDLFQTLPPYIYLLPGIALLGYGPATALVATAIVALPPAFRLTALGIRITPTEYLELGRASGIRPRQMFVKIRLPFAL